MVALVDERLLARAAAPGRIRDTALRAWAAAKADPRHARARFGEALRAARALHSAERRLVQDALYGLVREERGLAELVGADDPETLWLGWLVRRGLPPPHDRFLRLDGWDALPLAVRHAVPDALAPSFERALGSELGAFLAASDGRGPLVLRANLAACDRDRLAARLAGEGVRTRPCPHAREGLVVEGRANVEALASFREGWFEVQDEASQRVAGLAGRGPVVDLCAGAGGKSLALAARGLEVTACDVRKAALDELRRRARRARAAIRTVLVQRDGPVPLDPVPTVLVDAPCTGSGVLRRHPEHRWQWSAEHMSDLVGLQARILDRAAPLVAAGGDLVYATCSVLREEGEDQVDAFLVRHPRFALAETLRTWPHRDGGDAFFAAVLARTDER